MEENHCVSSDQIDSVLIDIDTPPGTSSPERPYTGNAGITEFTVSYTVRCAGGYTGDACDVCTGLDCVYGVCVGSDNDLSCSCDLGFTGTRCQTVIGSPDPDKGNTPRSHSMPAKILFNIIMHARHAFHARSNF